MESGAEGPAESLVRQVPLLKGERVHQQFTANQGLVDVTPATGPLLALTSRRLMAFTQGRDSSQALIIGLEDLHSVAVEVGRRRWPQLMRGVALALLGIAVYLFVGLYVVTTGSPFIPVVIGATVSFAGLLLVLRYLIWEPEGVISFAAAHGGAWQLSFQYHGNQAALDAHRVAECFFQLKEEGQCPAQGQEGDFPYTPWGAVVNPGSGRGRYPGPRCG